jgi:hypothetical protein
MERDRLIAYGASTIMGLMILPTASVCLTCGLLRYQTGANCRSRKVADIRLSDNQVLLQSASRMSAPRLPLSWIASKCTLATWFQPPPPLSSSLIFETLGSSPEVVEFFLAGGHQTQPLQPASIDERMGGSAVRKTPSRRGLSERSLRRFVVSIQVSSLSTPLRNLWISAWKWIHPRLHTRFRFVLGRHVVSSSLIS